MLELVRARHDGALALPSLAFVAALYLICVPVFAGTAPRCAPDRIDETVSVVHVYDGDTVKLDDGRRIRFIGLNTPELGHGKEPDQPLAAEGRSSLEHLLGPQSRVGLRFDSQNSDKYGRLLAHGYVANGHESLTAAMLRQGSGTLIVVPPNLWNWECYAAAEAEARRAQVGIWALPEFKPKPVSALPSKFNGYAIVHGRVERIGRSRDALWINLDARFAVRIRRADLEHFRGINFDQWSGRTVQARGWIRAGKNNALVMDVRHPSALGLDS